MSLWALYMSLFHLRRVVVIYVIRVVFHCVALRRYVVVSLGDVLLLFVSLISLCLLFRCLFRCVSLGVVTMFANKPHTSTYKRHILHKESYFKGLLGLFYM